MGIIKFVVVNGVGLSVFYISLTYLLKVCSHPRFPWKIIHKSVSTLTSPTQFLMLMLLGRNLWQLPSRWW